jgi:hypothetical protein
MSAHWRETGPCELVNPCLRAGQDDLHGAGLPGAARGERALAG